MRWRPSPCLVREGIGGRGTPIALGPVRRSVGERHFDQSGFQGGSEIRRGEVVSVSQSQGRLQLGAHHLVRQGRYEELDLPGALPCDLRGPLQGVLLGRFTADAFVHRKTDHEPGAVVVALEDRDR